MTADLIQRVVEQAVAIQQIPAPTFNEFLRTQYVKERFLDEGLVDVDDDELGNVYGRLPGLGNGPPVVVSAHLDSVFPEGTDLSVRRELKGESLVRVYGPGIGDNALGLAGLFGLLWYLQREQVRLASDVWLAANVGEEGLGDLRGMRAVVDRFGDEVRAYIILEGIALGQVYHRGLSVERYRITAQTRGGHSWVDFGRPSAIHELAALIDDFRQIPIPRQPRTTWNVGVISGGTSINTIAPRACLELDLRSESERTLLSLVEQVNQLVSVRQRAEVTLEMACIGKRPGGYIESSHPLVQLGMRCLKDQGIEPKLSIGSTDANVPLSRGLPAICVGLSTGEGAHTTREYIHVKPLRAGLGQLSALVKGVFEL